MLPEQAGDAVPEVVVVEDAVLLGIGLVRVPQYELDRGVQLFQLTLSSQLDGVQWVGIDASNFRNDWHGTHRA
jgi:hypothetical protein